MNKIERMLQELCPEGVEWKKLGEACIMQRGTSATKNTLTEGDIPVISGGVQPAYYCDTSNRDGETITVAGSGAGAGYVQYWNKPIFVCDAFSIKGKADLNNKYLYYVLKNMEDKIKDTKKGGGVPHVHISSIDKFEIPVPPFPIQEEIVRILDNLTNLAALLQAELQARQEQYEYYRNKLLTFSEIGGAQGVTWLKMSELGTFYSGLTGKTKADFTDGNATFITYMNVFSNAALRTDVEDKVKIYPDERQNTIQYGDILFTGSSETPEEVGMTSVLTTIPSEDIYLNSFCFGFRLNDITLFNPHFLKHYLRSKKMRKQIIKTANGVTRFNISKKKLEDVRIPIVSIEEQQRIVTILDKFETLVDDLSQGLPAEIAAVQEQYEYYRNKLLTFAKTA